jgi:hypothetical protein
LKHARYDISWIEDACLCREVQNSLVYFGTVTGPITISSTTVGIAAWLTNSLRYRFRVSMGKGDLPATIAKGRLADEGIMLVPPGHDMDVPAPIHARGNTGRLVHE